MASCGTFQKLRPLSLLAHLSSCYDSAQLRVFNNSVSWSIYLDRGKITYASHSVAPFDRIDCHLRRLSHQAPQLTGEIRSQLRLLFETDPESQTIPAPDYQAIFWLVEQQYLSSTQAGLLTEGLVKEVIESFLLVEEGTYELENPLDEELPRFCQLDLQPVVEYCQRQLRSWQALGPQIWSPYQRPYFLNRHPAQQQLVPEVQQKLNAILKGFSFRHLAVLLNQEEIQLARSLHPYVLNGTIVLQVPHPPFDQLPRTFEQSPPAATTAVTPTRIPPTPISPIAVDDTTIPSKIFSQVPASEVNARSPESSQNSVNTSPPISTAEPTLEQLSPEADENSADRLVKPDINATADRVTGNRLTPPASIDKSIYKIVCVDDSQAMLNQLQSFLDDESFVVSTINNPVKALMQIVRLKPDLILLDVKMSGIDGYELCKLLRNHSAFKHTPIVMVTGNTGIIDKVKARLVGASGYLAKPFKQSDLLKIIFKQLS